ncbi:MAG: BREX system ATP-binding domain-containing protein [Halolamina sp.]
MSQDTFEFRDQQRDYTQYDLEENPFPYSPVPADDPELYCGQDQATRAVEDTVSTVLSTGKSKHLVVTGKYGNGKSHTLKYTRSLVRDREDVVVGYVAQPGEGFLDIYHEFMYDIGFDGVERLAYEFLALVAKEETDHNPIGAQAMERLIDEGDILLSELVPTAVQRLNDIAKFADFARAIVHMIYEDTNLYAWQWITAEGLRYEQRKEMEIHSSLDDDTMGVRAFTAFKNMLLELGYIGVFVFVDEFESIARLKSKQKQSTLNSIRHLMDRNASGLCMLFACAPEVWQDVMSEYHAFSERIGQEVPLRPLTEEHIQDLVAGYLNTARPNGTTTIDPFTEESLSVILQRSQGNIRQVLSVCSRVLDEAVDEERQRIDAELVQDVI